MAKVLEKRFIHTSKEENFDLLERYGINDVMGTCYEVEVLVEIDTETGASRVVGCEGKMLSEQPYPEEGIGDGLVRPYHA